MNNASTIETFIHSREFVNRRRFQLEHEHSRNSHNTTATAAASLPYPPMRVWEVAIRIHFDAPLDNGLKYSKEHHFQSKLDQLPNTMPPFSINYSVSLSPPAVTSLTDQSPHKEVGVNSNTPGTLVPDSLRRIPNKKYDTNIQYCLSPDGMLPPAINEVDAIFLNVSNRNSTQRSHISADTARGPRRLRQINRQFFNQLAAKKEAGYSRDVVQSELGSSESSLTSSLPDDGSSYCYTDSSDIGFNISDAEASQTFGQSAVFDQDRYGYLQDIHTHHHHHQETSSSPLGALQSVRTTADLHLLRTKFVDRMDSVPSTDVVVAKHSIPEMPAIYHAMAKSPSRGRARSTSHLGDTGIGFVTRSRSISGGPPKTESRKLSLVFTDENALIQNEASREMNSKVESQPPQEPNAAPQNSLHMEQSELVGKPNDNNLVIYSRHPHNSDNTWDDDEDDDGTDDNAFFFSMPRANPAKEKSQALTEAKPNEEPPSPSKSELTLPKRRNPSITLTNMYETRNLGPQITEAHMSAVNVLVSTALAMMSTAQIDMKPSASNTISSFRNVRSSSSVDDSEWLNESPAVAAMAFAFRVGSPATKSKTRPGPSIHTNLISHISVRKEEGTNAPLAPPAAALLAVPYEVQINREMYSSTNLQRRVAIRKDSCVKASLKKVWKALPKVYVSELGEGVKKPSSTAEVSRRLQPFINFHIYKWFAQKLFNVLVVNPSVSGADASKGAGSSIQLSRAHKAQRYQKQFETIISRRDWVRAWTGSNYEALLTALKVAEKNAEEMEARDDSPTKVIWDGKVDKRAYKRNKKVSSMLPLPRLPNINTNRFLMDRAQFEFYLFLLADVWCETVLATEYSDFIEACFEVVFRNRSISETAKTGADGSTAPHALAMQYRCDYGGPYTVYDKRLVSEIFGLSEEEIQVNVPESTTHGRRASVATTKASVTPPVSNSAQDVSPKDASKASRKKNNKKHDDEDNFKVPVYCLPQSTESNAASVPPMLSMVLSEAIPLSAPSEHPETVLALFSKQRQEQRTKLRARRFQKELERANANVSEKASDYPSSPDKAQHASTRYKAVPIKGLSHRLSLQTSVNDTDSHEGSSIPFFESRRESASLSLVATGNQQTALRANGFNKINADDRDTKSTEQREQEKKMLLLQVQKARIAKQEANTGDKESKIAESSTEGQKTMSKKGEVTKPSQPIPNRTKFEENIFALMDHDKKPFSPLFRSPFTEAPEPIDDAGTDEERNRREFEALLSAAENQMQDEHHEQRKYISKALEDAALKEKEDAKAAIKAAAQKATLDRIKRDDQTKVIIEAEDPETKGMDSPHNKLRRRSSVVSIPDGRRRSNSMFSNVEGSTPHRSRLGSIASVKELGHSSDAHSEDNELDPAQLHLDAESKKRRHRRQDGFLSRLTQHKKQSSNSGDEEVVYDALISERLMEESKLKREQYAQSVRARRAEEKRLRDEERRAKEEADLKAQRKRLLQELEAEKQQNSPGFSHPRQPHRRPKTGKEDEALRRAKERRIKQEEEHKAQLLHKLKGSKAMLAELAQTEHTIQLAQHMGPLYHYQHLQNPNGGPLTPHAPRTPRGSINTQNHSTNSSLLCDDVSSKSQKSPSRPSSAPHTPTAEFLSLPLDRGQKSPIKKLIPSESVRVPRPPTAPPTTQRKLGFVQPNVQETSQMTVIYTDAPAPAPVPLGGADKVSTDALKTVADPVNPPVPLHEIITDSAYQVPIARELSTPEPGEITAPPTPLDRSVSSASEENAETAAGRLQEQQLQLAIEVRIEQLLKQLPIPPLLTTDPSQETESIVSSKQAVWKMWVRSIAMATISNVLSNEDLMIQTHESSLQHSSPSVMLIGGHRHYPSTVFQSGAFADSVTFNKAEPSNADSMADSNHQYWGGADWLSRRLEAFCGLSTPSLHTTSFGVLSANIAKRQHGQLRDRAIESTGAPPLPIRHVKLQPSEVAGKTKNQSTAGSNVTRACKDHISSIDTAILYELFTCRNSVKYLSINIPIGIEAITAEKIKKVEEGLPYLRAIAWVLGSWAEGLAASATPISSLAAEDNASVTNRHFLVQCIFPLINTIEICFHNGTSSLPLSSLLAGAAPPSAAYRLLLYSIVSSIAFIAAHQPSVGIVRIDPLITKFVDDENADSTAKVDSSESQKLFEAFLRSYSSLGLVGLLLDAEGPEAEYKGAMLTSTAGFCSAAALAEGALMSGMGHLLVKASLLGKRAWLKSALDVVPDIDDHKKPSIVDDVPCRVELHWCWRHFCELKRCQFVGSVPSPASNSNHVSTFLIRKAICIATESQSVDDETTNVVCLPILRVDRNDVETENFLDEGCHRYLSCARKGFKSTSVIDTITKEFGAFWTPSAASTLLRPSVAGVARGSVTADAKHLESPTSSSLTVATSKGSRIAPLVFGSLPENENSDAVRLLPPPSDGSNSNRPHAHDESLEKATGNKSLMNALKSRLAPYMIAASSISFLAADTESDNFSMSFSHYLRVLLAQILSSDHPTSIPYGYISTAAVGEILHHLCLSVFAQEPSRSAKQSAPSSYHYNAAVLSSMTRAASLEALRASWKARKDTPLDIFASASANSTAREGQTSEPIIALSETFQKGRDANLFLTYIAQASSPILQNSAILAATKATATTAPTTSTTIRANTMFLFAPQLTIAMPSIADLADFLRGCGINDDHGDDGGRDFGLTLAALCKGTGIVIPASASEETKPRSRSIISYTSSTEGISEIDSVSEANQERRYRKLAKRFMQWASARGDETSPITEGPSDVPALTALEFLSFMGV